MNDLEATGYTIADIELSDQQCDHIAAALPAVTGGRGGVKNLIVHPTVVQLLMHDKFGKYFWSVVGRDLVAVKATLFDKSTDANWRAQWHQDRAISVKERLDVPGYGPWTTKSGAVHVEPPAEVLAQMLTVRIHLDECGPDNGPLRVIPGSHRSGKYRGNQLADIVAAHSATELHLARGAILLMRPLLVHSSTPALTGDHRRVLHIELAPPEAISPLQWQNALRLRRAA